MKKTYKVLLLIGAVILILFIGYYFLQKNIYKKLENKYKLVESEWIALFEKSSVGVNLAEELLLITSDDYASKELYATLTANKSERDNYSKRCDLSFVKIEHDLNEAILDLESNVTNDDIKYKDLLNKIKINNISLNRASEQYNQTALLYNKSFSVFPNFIIAKKHGLVRAKFFTIICGERNVDPIEKSKEMPDWAKGIEV